MHRQHARSVEQEEARLMRKAQEIFTTENTEKEF